MAKQSYTLIEGAWIATSGPAGPVSTVPGPQGTPGEGVPTGGSAGQALVKNSATDFDTDWATPAVGGATILSGTAAPSAGTGADGDYYLDTDDRILYGPKKPLPGTPTQSAYTTQTPTGSEYNDWSSFGSDVRFATSGLIKALRHYWPAEAVEPSGRTMKIWSSGGSLLVTAVVPRGSAGSTGWQTISIAPLAVAAAQTVRVSVDTPGGANPIHYWPNPATDVVTGDLTLIKTGLQMPAGGTGYPNTASTRQRFVDIEFESTAEPNLWPVALKSVPPGGTTSQVLAKTSATDYAANWSTPPATGDPAGTAAAAITVHEAAANPHPVYLTQAEGDALYGGGGLQTRATATKTTASLAHLAAETGTIALANGYRLYSITCSAPCRVRLYTTTAKRDADTARAIGVDPGGDHGLQFEFVATNPDLAFDLTPLVDGFDGKAVPDGVIPITITNMSGAAAAITVTLIWIRTE